MVNLKHQNKEILDVINENEVTVELRSRDDVHRLGLLHREVHVWLFDEDHDIYFQKSAVHRSSAGLFDASIGGHVDMGEDYIISAVREIKEESGLVITPPDLVFLTKFRGVSESKKKKTVNNFIRSVYIYKYPVKEERIKADPVENDGFQKFSLNFLSTLSDKDALLFHKYVPTHELPHVFNYLNKIS